MDAFPLDEIIEAFTMSMNMDSGVICSETSSHDMRRFGFKVIKVEGGEMVEGVWTDSSLVNILNRLTKNYGELSYCYVEELPGTEHGVDYDL